MWHMEEELQTEGVSVSLLKEIQKFRESHVVDASVAGRVPVPRFFILWQRNLGRSGSSVVMWGEFAVVRSEGNWQKRIGGKSGSSIRQTVLGYFFLCECGCRFPHWNRHIPG